MKRKTAFISAVLTGLLMFNVSAAQITEVKVSDFDNSIVTVTGTTEDALASVTAVKKDTSLSAGTYNSESDMSVQQATITDGKFNASFQFIADTGWYDFYVSGNTTPFAFEMISKTEILAFVSDLGTAKFSKTELPAKLTYYTPSMGVDIAFANTEGKMSCLAENMITYCADIASNGIPAVSAIAARTKAEVELLDGLAAAQTSTVVNNLLTSYATPAQFDISAYSTLDDYGKTYVCDALMGQSYTNMAAFLAAFNPLVSSAPAQPSATPAPYYPMGGGGGGSSVGGTVVLPPAADSQSGTTDGRVIFERFNDIDSVPWAWEAILYLSDHNVINGVGDNSFMPDAKVKREQLAKMMAVAFNCNGSGSGAGFADVAAGDWSVDYIAAVKEHGLMNGIDENLFGFGMNVSRQDLCVTIYRAAKNNGYVFTNQKTDFKDFDEISDYAKEAVSYLAGEGIISGDGDGSVLPHSSATRAETAKILYSVMTSLLNK